MIYCYSNGGLSYRAVDQDYTAQSGEAIFNFVPNADQLAVAFPGYATSFAAEQAQSQARLLLDASDTTINRIAEAVALGLTTWTTADVVVFVNYRRALRAVLSGASNSVPIKPPYPAGT